MTKTPSPYSRLSESTRLSCELGQFSDEESQQLVPMESIKNVKRGNNLSHCKCLKSEFKNGLYICSHAKEWLKIVEQNTDMPIDFEYSQIFYENA